MIITGLMLYCPLFGKTSFMLDIRLLLPAICSLWLLLKQKELNWENIKKYAATDGYSTILIVIVGMITQALPVFEWKIEGLTWLCTPASAWTYVGGILLFGGLFLRLQAIEELREFFTNEVRLDNTWKLIQTGVYKYIRNPSYLGAIMTMIGTSILLESWLSLVVSAFLLMGVYLYRIKLEEKLLIAHFGEQYLLYMEKTYALIPFIF